MKKKIILIYLLTLGTLSLLQAQDQQKFKNQNRIRLEEHYKYFDGQLFQYQNGKQTRVMEQQRLNNGTILNPDGSYQLQNQERYQLRQGEILDKNGSLYRNQNKFNKGKSITNHQMIQRQKRESIQRKTPSNRGKMSPSRRGGKRGVS